MQGKTKCKGWLSSLLAVAPAHSNHQHLAKVQPVVDGMRQRAKGTNLHDGKDAML